MAAEDRRPATDLSKPATRAERLARKRQALAAKQRAEAKNQRVIDVWRAFDRSMDDVRSVAEKLFSEPYKFNVFQAVRLLEMMDREESVGRSRQIAHDSVRFAVHQSPVFPASAIQTLEPGRSDIRKPPRMTVNFFGLTGPSGVLPEHYTELLMRQAIYDKHAEKYALRDWFDLFNHRLLVLFHRSWEKYRFWVAYERLEHLREEPDSFTQAMRSLVGIGTLGLTNRLHVSPGVEPPEDQERPDPLAEIDDQSILYFAGFFSEVHRNATSLELLLSEYFGLAIQVQQFQGEWLRIEPSDITRLGSANASLGMNMMLGERVWDVTGKFRLRLGPLNYRQFCEFLPDRQPIPERKGVFVLAHMTRLYVGPEVNFDFQLVLKASEIPAAQLGGSGLGARLGWNTWLISRTPEKNAEEAVFPGENVTWLAAGQAG